jgi:hypothetical protein
MMLYQLVSGGLHPYSSVAGGRNSKVAALKSFVPVQLPHHLPDIPGLRSVLPTLGRIFRPVRFSHPPPRCQIPNSPWPGIIKLFPVSDISPWERKAANFFSK